MGRLDDIIRRNRGERRSDRIWLYVKGVALLVIIGLIIFSDLALNDEQRAAKEAADRRAKQPPAPHVDNIKLYRPPVRAGSGSATAPAR
ncbi:MAG TPA: hypothetical protein VFQ53_39750 [Kofleriaceae bacterium]|nr:hypothetical protein [Kofleriaceae bacterium]